MMSRSTCRCSRKVNGYPFESLLSKIPSVRPPVAGPADAPPDPSLLYGEDASAVWCSDMKPSSSAALACPLATMPDFISVSTQ